MQDGFEARKPEKSQKNTIFKHIIVSVVTVLYPSDNNTPTKAPRFF